MPDDKINAKPEIKRMTLHDIIVRSEEVVFPDGKSKNSKNAIKEKDVLIMAKTEHFRSGDKIERGCICVVDQIYTWGLLAGLYEKKEYLSFATDLSSIDIKNQYDGPTCRLIKPRLFSEKILKRVPEETAKSYFPFLYKAKEKNEKL